MAMNEMTEEKMLEISAISDKWVEDLWAAFRAEGVIVTDYLILLHALHAMAHAFDGVPLPHVAAAAYDEAAAWYEDCASKWTDEQFAAMIERGALTHNNPPAK